MTYFFICFPMFLSNSYLNINLNNTNSQNLKQLNPFPIRNVTNIQNIFSLKSSSASRIFTSKSRDFDRSRFERNGMSFIDWKEVQKRHKNELSWMEFPSLKNLSVEMRDLDFQNSYHFLFLSRIWLFDLSLNSISQKFSQTPLFQKFLNTLKCDEAEKISVINSNTYSSFSLNTFESCFEKNFSTSQLSNFSHTKNLLFKNGNFIKQHQSRLFFMEFYQYSLKTNSDMDLKTGLTRDSMLSNELFFKSHRFLNFFLCTLGLGKLDSQQNLNKKTGNFNTNTKLLQNSLLNSKCKKGNFFVFKEVFYLYAYSLFHEFYVKDSNAKVFSFNFNVFKVWQNRDLNFAFFSQTNQRPVSGNLKDLNTSFFFNTYANKYHLFQSNLNSTIKDSSLENGLFKSILSKNFTLNKTNPIINKMFLDNLRFAWLHLNLKLTFNHTNMGSYSYGSQIKKPLLMNSFYLLRQSPFLKTSPLYLLESPQANIRLEKVLKTKSWASRNLQLLQYEQKFRKKPLLNFWTYFFANSDFLMLVLSKKDFHFQNIRPLMAALNEWFLNSLTFLNFSNMKPRGKHLHQTFSHLNLVSKHKVKQKVVSDFLNQRVFCHSLLRDFKTLVKNSGSLTQSDLILKLTSLLYIYSYSFSKEWDFNSVRMLDKEMFDCLWKWACRRHNNKSKKWIRSKYFTRLTPTLWVFGCSEEVLELKNKNKVLSSSSDSMNFLYLPRLSEVLFHLSKSLSKKFE